jgi:triacylglycerol lipase
MQDVNAGSDGASGWDGWAQWADLTGYLGAAQDLRGLLTPDGVRGALVEAAWMSAHLAMYPLGLLRQRQNTLDWYGLADLMPVQRGLAECDVEAAGTPILLVHGMIDNRAIFTVLSRQLRRRGFQQVLTVNYSPTTNDIRAAARRLSAEIEGLVARTGYERIQLVGHSLGGLIARYYVQCLGGDARVRTLVTLGSPHAGTLLARLVPPMLLCRQLSPGSDLYAELAGPATGCRTRFVSYYSDVDQLIVPRQSARIEHPDLDARNVLVQGAGHMSLPIDHRVVRDVAGLLSRLKSDLDPELDDPGYAA